MSDKPVSLTKAREQREWDSSNNPADHTPLAALKAIIRDIENGDHAPDGICIVHVTKNDKGGGSVGYYTAGLRNRFEVAGILEDAKLSALGVT